MHRRVEYGQIVAILLAAVVAAFALRLDGPAGPDHMSTLAQIIRVLLVARIVQHEWRVGKDAAEIDGRQPEFVERFLGIELKPLN